IHDIAGDGLARRRVHAREIAQIEAERSTHRADDPDPDRATDTEITEIPDGDARAGDMNIARVRDASGQGAGTDANADRLDAGREPGNRRPSDELVERGEGEVSGSVENLPRIRDAPRDGPAIGEDAVPVEEEAAI